jgi:hypothetical protein
VKRGSLPFFRAEVDEFFEKSWLSFHSLVVQRAIIRKELHASWDEARRKHFTMLLQRKIRDCVSAHPYREQTFRVWLDPMHSAYPRAAEMAEIITRAIISRRHSNATLESVIESVCNRRHCRYWRGAGAANAKCETEGTMTNRCQFVRECEECQRLLAELFELSIRLNAARDDLKQTAEGDKRSSELKREVELLRKGYSAAVSAEMRIKPLCIRWVCEQDSHLEGSEN